MSWDCLLINRANLLLLKPSPKEWMTPTKDNVEKEVAFLAKNFQKFMKMKKSGKLFSKGKFSSSKGDRKESKKKDGKEFQSP